MTAPNKLDPAIKTAWLEALRSGRYSQTRQALRTNAGMCCLGVLCDVLASQGHGEWTRGDPLIEANTDWIFTAGGEADHCILPARIRRLAFPTTLTPRANPTVSTVGLVLDRSAPAMTTLAELNDQHDLTFSQLADLIEESL